MWPFSKKNRFFLITDQQLLLYDRDAAADCAARGGRACSAAPAKMRTAATLNSLHAPLSRTVRPAKTVFDGRHWDAGQYAADAAGHHEEAHG